MKLERTDLGVREALRSPPGTSDELLKWYCRWEAWLQTLDRSGLLAEGELRGLWQLLNKGLERSGRKLLREADPRRE